jgi:hypothetical protein
MREMLSVAAWLAAAVSIGEPQGASTPLEPTGTIHGRTVFIGDPSEYVPVPVHLDDRFGFCLNLAEPVRTEHVVLNRTTQPATLRNVLVWVHTPLDAKTFPIPKQPVLLEQRDCRFAPRVVALMAGQTLRVVNRDPVLCHTHFLPEVNKELSYTIPKQGGSRDFTFVPEWPIPVKSDVYPWIIAWVAVFDHPFFAVSGEDGSFALNNLPPGKYTLEAWHETFGRLHRTVHLGRGEREQLVLRFEPPRKTP